MVTHEADPVFPRTGFNKNLTSFEPIESCSCAVPVIDYD